MSVRGFDVEFVMNECGEGLVQTLGDLYLNLNTYTDITIASAGFEYNTL
ncbi:hypothetical protein ACP6L2_03350 [Sphingobacterium lactis]